MRNLLWLVAVILTTQAFADIAAGEKKGVACQECHGPAGNSQNPMFPILAGQNSRYIYLQLKDFKEGRREDAVMSPQAASLAREDMLDLAEFFAAQKQKPNGFKADAEKAERGKKISDAVLCPMCHLGGFSGQNDIPRVAGQQFEYIIKQLTAFKARTRTNDAGNMTAVAANLSERDIDDLAHYIANLN